MCIYSKSYSDFTKTILRLAKIPLRFSQDHTPIFTESHSDFHKIILRLCQNHTPIFTKKTGCFSQHHKLIFTKSHSDFSKIILRLCQNHTPIFTKSLADFHKITDWSSQKRGLILKPQIVVLLYAFSKPHPPPLCVLLVRRFQQIRHEPVG